VRREQGIELEYEVELWRAKPENTDERGSADADERGSI